jgi:hypothetical protein
MLKKLIFALAAVMVTAGSAFGSFGIHVRFDTIDNLKKMDRVISDDVKIGHVEKVVYGDDGVYTATLQIKQAFRDDVTEHTRFVLTYDPEFADRQAVELIQSRMGGAPLKNGSTIEGADKYAVILEMMKDDVKDGIGYLEKEYKHFSESLRTLSEHEKIQRLKKTIARLGNDLKKESRETRETIVKEIIPMLEREIKELRQQLKEFGREDEVEPLEKELKKIKYI